MAMWYPLLVRGDNALSKAKPHVFNKNVVVCRQDENGGRHFAQFDSFAKYYGHYFFDIEPRARRDYEVIYGGACQKLYFDFDLAADAVIGVPVAEIDASVARFVAVLRDRVFADEKVPIRVLVFSSSSPVKFSYHVVVCGIAFCSHSEVAAVAHFTMEEAVYAESEIALNRALIDSADMGVYKSTQQLRVLGSRKAASAREKVFRADLSSTGSVVYAVVPTGEARAPPVKLFMDSLVTETSSSRPPDVRGRLTREIARRNAPRPRQMAVWEGSEWTGDGDAMRKAVSCLLKHVQRVYNVDVPFCVREGVEPTTRDGATVVPMDRMAPSMCPTCDHVHDHENPFIILTDKFAYFKCRRGNALPAPRICIDSSETLSRQKLSTRQTTTTTPLTTRALSKVFLPGDNFEQPVRPAEEQPVRPAEEQPVDEQPVRPAEEQPAKGSERRPAGGSERRRAGGSERRPVGGSERRPAGRRTVGSETFCSKSTGTQSTRSRGSGSRKHVGPDRARVRCDDGVASRHRIEQKLRSIKCGSFEDLEALL